MDEYSRYPSFYQTAHEETYAEQCAKWEMEHENDEEENSKRQGYWVTRKEVNEIELGKFRTPEGKTVVSKSLIDKYGWDRLSVQGVDRPQEKEEVPLIQTKSGNTDINTLATYVRGQNARTEPQIKEWLLNDVGVTVPQMNQIIARAKSNR